MTGTYRLVAFGQSKRFTGIKNLLADAPGPATRARAFRLSACSGS